MFKSTGEPSPTEFSQGSAKPRALFYVFDGGSGIGHLRRLSRIAAAMQERFSCMVVSSHAASAWIVPPGCEYVRLPSWDKMIPSRSSYWGRPPFLDVTVEEAASLRREIIHGIIRGFKPDVLFVDHLPLGAFSELEPIVRSARCMKYLVTRGVQNETEDLERLIFGGDAAESLARDYHRVFSAIDPAVFDIRSRYALPADIAGKIQPVGYIAPPDAGRSREDIRASRGLAESDRWVVASAGSGQWGEPLMEACIEQALQNKDAHFDIVMGPRSRRVGNAPLEQMDDGRIRLHSACENLAELNAASDVVVTCGGYNTLLESLRGQARIVCLPYRKDPRDEPFFHAKLLEKMVHIDVSTDLACLPAMLKAAIGASRNSVPGDRRMELRMDGASEIAKLVSEDLGLARPQAGR